MTLKIKIRLAAAFLSLAFAGTFAAGEPEISYKLKTDGAYYLKSGIRTGNSHVSPVTGPFDGFELRSALEVSALLPTPLGTHPLFSGATVECTGGIEISPVTLRPSVQFEFLPVPFLILNAGASIGTGWNILGFDGFGVYNTSLTDYEDLKPFRHYFYDAWMGGTLQFDTGILWPGEWTHVVLQVGYEVKREAVTGVDDGEIWVWMESENHANGFLYTMTAFLGYQMPWRLNLLGVMFLAKGHFDGSDYGDYDATFDGSFRTYTFNMLANLKLNASNSIAFLGVFNSRRSFDSRHSKETEEPILRKTGREWFVDGISFRWEHLF